METITYLKDFLKHEVKDLFSAETQLLDALPLMADAATNKDLKKAFRDHLAVTKQHRSRLEKVQQLLDKDDGAQEKTDQKGFFARLFSSKEGSGHCRAMEGLIKEAQKIIDEAMPNEVKDAALIAAAQKVEHYEISSYGTARAFALQVGMKDVAALLEQTLDEEYSADDLLTSLAYNGINAGAEGSDAYSKLLKSSREQNRASVRKDAKATKAAAKKTAGKATGTAARKTGKPSDKGRTAKSR